MTDAQSPFETSVATLRKKLNETQTVDRVGPRDFVDAVVERADNIKKRRNPGVLRGLCADTLPLERLVADSEHGLDPWAEVETLFLRAFQSMRSRKDLRKFVIAIDDGRLNGPVDLTRIDPAWCDAAHALYAHCWSRISKKSGDLKSEAKLGVVLLRKMMSIGTGAIAELKQDKTIATIVERLAGHEPSMALIGRLTRFTRQGDTARLFTDAYAHGQALMHGVDLAAVARKLIRLAQSKGVDTSSGMAPLTQLMGMMKGS